VKHWVNLALGACALAGGFVWSEASVVSATSPTSSTPSASTLLEQAVQNAEMSGWVHEVSVASGSGHKFSMVNDIGTREGRQVIISDGAHATVLVVAGNAYIYGNDAAIAKYFEISTTDPQKFANQWLELTPQNPDFSTVSAAVTLSSDFRQVAIPGALHEGQPVEVDGHKVRPISGHIPATSQAPAATATIYVTTKGTVLPVEYRIVAKGIKSTTSWTQWGRAVQIAVPPSSTPLS
jgi:hypothetical protein